MSKETTLEDLCLLQEAIERAHEMGSSEWWYWWLWMPALECMRIIRSVVPGAVQLEVLLPYLGSFDDVGEPIVPPPMYTLLRERFPRPAEDR